MKKVLLIIASLMLICVLLSSCKVNKDCPAYGKAIEDNIEQKV